MPLVQFQHFQKTGQKIQEAMFLFQKILLFISAFSSLFYSFLAYCVQLFTEVICSYDLVILSVTISTSLLLF